MHKIMYYAYKFQDNQICSFLISRATQEIILVH